MYSFNGVTIYRGIWRKGTGKRGLEWEGGCRKARLGVGGKVPESETWNGRKGAGKRGLECGLGTGCALLSGNQVLSSVHSVAWSRCPLDLASAASAWSGPVLVPRQR